MPRPAFVVLGNQLFPFAHVKDHRDAAFFMAEDVGLCTYVRHHQQKIVLFLAAMRSHADELRAHGCEVTYRKLAEPADAEGAEPYENKLARFLDDRAEAGEAVDELIVFEIEDRFFEERIEAFADARGLKLRVLESPMFLTSRPQFAEYLDDANGRPFMAKFYERQRRRLDLLMDHKGRPVGGRWSYDTENRQRLGKDVDIPQTSWAEPTDHVRDVQRLVKTRFADHPGDAAGFWLPTTRRQALAWLRAFLEERFAAFGPYEDAFSGRDPVLFHSVLTPVLNLGLLTPREVIDRAVDHAQQHDIPLNSLEGFVRQIIGWREFIRGIYQHYDERQQTTNHWNAQRRLRPCWYDGTTGMPPLDEVIRKAHTLGWTHHIERLMVAGNLLNLCEVHPHEAHRWFMEMYVDSSDWVMGPNVYGMGLMSDGGVFATKPYICGSNYLLKMGDGTAYQKGDWCDALDGLYWRFIDRHRQWLAGNARLGQVVGTLDRMDAGRKERIFNAASAFVRRVTVA